ncbi:hypothetical protein R3P38DRAFT_2888014 [Favolaschia claudopus]|uniref:F-box domain-containing protein n=1 Tax=Favolaschia claudopus TaxID=2862362 RepID=A0AAW0CRR5_9AGAR
MDDLPDISLLEISDQPRLPPELERTIFEFAAFLNPKDIPNTMLVAWRVKRWMEALLYRIIVATYAEGQHMDFASGCPFVPLRVLLKQVHGKESSSIGLFARRFFCDSSHMEASTLDAVVTACPHLTHLHLYMNANPAHLPILNRLHSLLEVAIDIKTLFRGGAVDFGSPFLRHVTHLELLDDDFEEALLSDLVLISDLTHLSFNIRGTIAPVHNRIRSITQLKCIVFFKLRHTAEEMHPSCDDDRLVCISQTSFREDWLRGASTDEDYWALADEFIAAKRVGKVDKSLYFIKDNDSSWKS